ncbi:peptidoglycan-binding protein [Breoghania sp. JC706]|uniref:peptidoglycan-binding protein n=1 Tax=Breoghania sp. JC706 TaxID=3117732 RepID=UPI00300A1AEF
MSWSIRELDNDARERAAEAAARAGMTVDEWLASLIRAGSGETARAPSLGERGERLRASAAPTPSMSRAPAPRVSDKDNISEIASALDRLLAENAPRDGRKGRAGTPGESDRASRREPRPASSRAEQPARPDPRTETRTQSRAPARNTGTSGASPQDRSQRVERVLAALGKLDERVRSLSSVRAPELGDEPARAVDAFETAPSAAPRADDLRSADRRQGGRRQSDRFQSDRFQSYRSEPDRLDADQRDLPPDGIERRRTAPRYEERAPVQRFEPAPYEPAPYRSASRQPGSREAGSQAAAPSWREREQPAVFADRRAGQNADFERHFRDLAERIDSLREPRDGAFADLRAEIADLRGAIERRERDGLSDRDLGDISRLVASVERIERDGLDPQLAEDVRHEIADLRDLVISQNIDGAMKTLESGYAHIVERLDDMRRQIHDPHALSVLEQRLDDIEQGLADIPRASSFAAFDDRLDDMAGRLHDLAARGGLQGLDHLEREMRDLRAAIGEIDIADLVRTVDGQLRDLGERIEAVAQGTQGLSGDLHERLLAFEDRLPDRDILDALNHRMERISSMLAEDRASAGGTSERMDERLGEILGRLDRIERQGGAPADFERLLSQLERRIEGLTNKLDTLDGLPLDAGSLEGAIARLDAATDRLGGERIADMHTQLANIVRALGEGGGNAGSEIAALRQDVSALRNDLTHNETLVSAIEPQIQQLARSLVIDAGGAPDDAKLERIEQQIAVIAGQLDATEDRLSGLGDIEAVLERIDASLAGRPQESSSGAGGSNASDDAINALRGDLARLFEAAQGNRRETDDSIEKVQKVLNDIVARLAALENDSEAEDEIGYAEVAVGGGGGHRVAVRRPPQPPRERSFSGGAEDRSDETGAHDEAPVDEPDFSTVEDLPLEPGSGKPDLAALLRAQAAEVRGQMPGGDRKADFIAAARRAAQAAAAEVAAGEDAAGTQTRDRGAWLRDKLKRSRTEDRVEPVSAEEAAERGMTKKERKAKRKEQRAATADAASGSASRLRRPLVYAAAAVILTIGALKVATVLDVFPGDKAPVTDARVAGGKATSTPAEAGNAPGGAVSGSDARAVPGGDAAAVRPAPSSTPDKAVTFQPPAAEPGTFAAPDAVQPYGEFENPPATGAGGANSDAPGANSSPNAGSTAAPKAPSASLPEEAVGPLALRMAAANGNPRAEFEIALRYTEGKGVPADLAKAAEWYRRAADAGLAPAQYRIGSFYEKGRGVRKDLAEARKWYQRAADQGNVKAMHNLAVLLADGGLGKPDFAGAARWFQKAAEHGVRDSQFNLGVLYARGLGVPKDMAASYKWFAIAAKLGDSDAAAKRDEIANSLPEGQLAEARKAVNSWQQKTIEDGANRVIPDDAWKANPDDAASNAQDTVKQAQLLLGRLGYDPGPADGVVGPKTVDAIRLFQVQAGLPVDGAIDARLIRALAGRSI